MQCILDIVFLEISLIERKNVQIDHKFSSQDRKEMLTAGIEILRQQ